MKTRTLLVSALWLSLFAASLSGTDTTMLKLTGHWTNTPSNFRMGFPVYGAQLVACSDKWIVACAPEAKEQANGLSRGAVQVFNAVTGAWVRKLMPPASLAGTGMFGTSCTISGDKAVIGAYGTGVYDDGAVYVFNLANGALLKTFKPADQALHQAFGCSVAVTGSKLIIGAANVPNNVPGTCYVYDMNTGIQLAKLFSSDPGTNNGFGLSVSAEGDTLAIGAPFADGARGACYLFDLGSYTQIRKIQTADSVAGDAAGISVSMSQGIVVIGASGSNFDSQGKIFTVNIFTGAEQQFIDQSAQVGAHFGLSVAANQGQFLSGGDAVFDSGSIMVGNITLPYALDVIAPPDNPYAFHKHFGESVALYGNTAVVAAPYDSSQASGAGALYLIRPIQRRLPLSKVTSKGEFAPGAPDVTFATIGDCFTNDQGEIAFTSTLGGVGSNGGKDSGVWTTLPNFLALDLGVKSRQLSGALSIGTLSKPLINRSETAIFQSTLTGLGVTAYNNQAIYRYDGQTPTQALRTGVALAAVGNASPLAFTQVVQNRGVNRFGAAITLRQISGQATAATDSAIICQDIGTQSTEAVREGADAGSTGLKYGQFTGRVAGYFSALTYTTAATNSPSGVGQAVFQKSFGNSEILVAKYGDPAPSFNNGVFSTFIGETSDSVETVLMRVTVATPGIPNAGEGLWKRDGNTVGTRIMVKGDLLPGLANVKIAKFINFWQAGGQSLALVQLSGTGVTAANDQALLLSYQKTLNNYQTMILMREGDPAPGCDPATIGTINRVEVDPLHGHYLVLATLAGAPAGTELALFRGFSANLFATTAELALRRPVPVLRKGFLYSNQPSKIKSMSLPTTNLTASGAGGTGLGRAISEPYNANNATQIVLAVDFDNGVHQLLNGVP